MQTEDRPTFPLLWPTCIAKHPSSAKRRLHGATVSLLLAQRHVRSSVRHSRIVIELLRQLFWQCETTLLEDLCWVHGYDTIMCSLMNLFWVVVDGATVKQRRSTSTTINIIANLFQHDHYKGIRFALRPGKETWTWVKTTG